MADNHGDMLNSLMREIERLRISVIKVLIDMERSTMDSEQKRLLYEEMTSAITTTKEVVDCLCNVEVSELNEPTMTVKIDKSNTVDLSLCKN